MKKLAVIITALVFVFLAAACQADDITIIELGKKQLQKATPETPQYVNNTFGVAISLKDDLSPLKAQSVYNLMLAPLVFDTLTSIGEDFTARPCLAQSFELDGQTWIFKIRDNVFFHDGTPLAAKDVVNTINAVMRDKNSYYHKRTEKILSVRADGQNVLVTLKVPDALFPETMDIPIVKTTSGPDAVIGTGRYKFVQTSDGFALAKNDAWWGGKVSGISRIELVDVEGGDSFLLSLESHDIDAAAIMPGDSIQPRNITDFAGYEYNTNQFCFIGYNGKNKVLAQKAVRQAISYLIDRAALIEQTYGGKAAPCLFGVNPAWKYYDASLEPMYSYSVEKAALLLAQAGFSKNASGIFQSARGEALQFRLLVNFENPGRFNFAKQLALSLLEAGIVLTLDEASWTQYSEKLKKGDFDLYIGEVKMPGDFDFKELCLSGGSLNYGKINLPQFSQAMDEFASSDRASLAQSARQLQLAFAEELPVIPLFYSKGILYLAKNVKGNIKPLSSNVYANIHELAMD